MTREFVPYIEALELKSLGFDEPCFGYYENSEFIFWHDSKQEKELLLNCSAPLYQQAFRWFREHQEWPIDSWIRPYISQQPRSYGVFIWTRGQIIQAGVFSTYDEAELNLLRKLIEIVKTKQ